MWFDLEGVADTKYKRMMLEGSLEDATTMTKLDMSWHHLQEKFKKMILGPSLATGVREQITYEILHKGWSMQWCSFLCASQHAFKIERKSDMASI